MAVRTLDERTARSLTDARVGHAKPSKHCDLNGLSLLVGSGGTRRCVQRIMIQGKRRDLGLGTYPLVSLAEARVAAADNHKVARAGGDPTARASVSIVPTFAEAADQVIEMHTPGWKNGGKTAKQWQASRGGVLEGGTTTRPNPALAQRPPKQRYSVEFMPNVWRARRTPSSFRQASTVALKMWAMIGIVSNAHPSNIADAVAASERHSSSSRETLRTWAVRSMRCAHSSRRSSRRAAQHRLRFP